MVVTAARAPAPMLEPPAYRIPGTSFTAAKGSRKPSLVEPIKRTGRLFNCDSVTFWATSLVSVFSSEDSAFTVTDSVALAHFKRYVLSHRLGSGQVELGVGVGFESRDRDGQVIVTNRQLRHGVVAGLRNWPP